MITVNNISINDQERMDDMSYWAAYHGQGLVLTTQEFNGFLERYKKAVKKKKYLEQVSEMEEGNIDISDVDFITPDGRKFEVINVDDSCTEGFRLVPYRVNGKPNRKWNPNEDIPMTNVYVICSDKAIEGMDCFKKKAYKSYEEFVDEFRGKAAAYLPKDFDWDSHIGIFSYACYA